jgi:hypothetical protein
MKLLAVFTVLTLFLLIGTVSATNYYTIDWFSSFPASTSKPAIAFNPSIFSDADNCTANLQVFGTFETISPYTSVTTYYCPNDIIVGTSPKSVTGNLSCFNYGIQPCTSALGGMYETKSSTSWGGTTGYVVLKTGFTCQDESDWLTFNINNNSLDSRGFIPNAYASTYLSHLQSSNFEPCTQSPLNMRNVTEHINSGDIIDFISFFVFNSSDSGIANISVNNPINWSFVGSTGKANEGYSVIIYDLATSTYSTLCTSLPCNTQVTLSESETYVLAVNHSANYNCFGITCDPVIEVIPNYTVSINIYQPDWVCFDWSECVNGTQWRRCYDANGRVPDKIETRGCYSLPEQTLYLGIRDYYSSDVWYCQKDWTCGAVTTTKNVDFPANWTVVNTWVTDNATSTSAYIWDFLKISDDYSADGDAVSLKMWYVPPKGEMATSTAVGNITDVICSNATTGGIPQITRPINETIFIERNITFPSPYMTLYFNVRKCRDPELQYPSPNIFGWEYCGHPDACYTHSGSCNETVKGRIFTSLYDINTSETIFTYIDDVIEWRTWEGREFEIDELETDHNYSLRFALLPKYSSIDTDSYCIYLDNINFYIRTQEFTCESFCDTSVYGLLHRANDISGACEFTEEPLSPSCISPELIPPVQNNESFCDPRCADSSYAYYEYNEELDIYETHLNSDYCRDKCIEEAEQERITQPLTVDDIESTTNLLFTPLFLSILISLSAGGIVIQKVGSKELGLLATMLFLIVFTLAGLFPIWLLILVGIIGGFILSRSIMSMLNGGG